MVSNDVDVVPPVLCLLYAEFDAHAGPRVVFQVPDEVEFVTKEMFDSLSAFIIPKSDLVDRLVKVDLTELKIMGYPKAIKSRRYERNALIFNLCFVVPNVSEIDFIYEPLVEKLANYLEAFELECSFVSDEGNRGCLKEMMLSVFRQLNENRGASLVINDKCQVQLKLQNYPNVYPQVLGSMAPTLRRSIEALDVQRCDIVLQKILPHINGFDTVAKISSDSGVDLAIAKRYLKDAVHDGLVCLHPVFSYCSRYAVTPNVTVLYRDLQARQQFCSGVALVDGGRVPEFRDVFRLLNSIQPTMSIKQWYLRTQPRNHGVDERRLVQTAVCRGMLRKLSGYPVLTELRRAVLPNMLFRLKLTDLDGRNTLEELAIKAQLSVADVHRLLFNLPFVTIVWK